MATVPVPQRGQPIDLTYIYKIAEEVNNLSRQSAYSTNKFVSVDTPGAGVGRQDIKVGESRIIGGYKEIASNATITDGQSVAFFYDFPAADFKYPPVVTVTPMNVSGTDAGKNVLVILTSVTTSRIEGIVRFNVKYSLSCGKHYRRWRS